MQLFAFACLALVFLSALLPSPVRFAQEKSTRLDILVRAIPARELAPIERTDTAKVYAGAHRSVVTVHCLVGGKKKSQGSGAFIGRDEAGSAYILTNKHVVYHSSTDGEIGYKVTTWDGREHPAELEFFSRKRDLALLRVARMPGDPLTVRRDAQASLSVGDQVFALGTPGGLEQTLTAGIISALRKDYIQTDATIMGGSSGSPLLDGRGWLCGVLTKSHREKNYAFAIYGDDVADVLRERTLLKGRSLPSS